MTDCNLFCFHDGFVLDRNTILVAAQYCRNASDDISVALMIKDGIWRKLLFEDAALSVAALRQSRIGFYLGANGSVLIIGDGPPRIELVGDIARYGEMLRIKNVAEHIYACGMNGQVYSRVNNSWEPVGKGLLGMIGFDIEDLDGTAPDDLWAIGTKSDVWHFDGRRWQQMHVPTNRPFGGVRCLNRNRIYLCGDDGNFFVGNEQHWEYIGDPEFDDIFWAVEAFKETIFLAYDGGVMCYNGESIKKIDFESMKLGKVDGYRLNAADGVLWSFGIDTLLCYDGIKWVRVMEPIKAK